MKKIFWLIVLIITGYVISVFLAPNFADKIGDILGIKSFNEKMRNSGEDLNKISTNIPNSNELQEGYNDAIKKAGDFKTSVVNGIETTKNQIDGVRASLSGAEDTINKAKNIINDTVDTVDKIKGTINDVNKMGDAIKGSVNTENVK